MTATSFTVPGDPQGKGRAKPGVTRGGKPVMYTPGKTVAYEGLIALLAREAHASRPLFDGPVQFEAIIRFSPPASASKVKRAAMLAGDIQPTRKPDVDNTVKALFDGCNGVVFRDDVQVTRLLVSKVYAEEPGVDVRVLPINPAPAPVQEAAA